MKSSLNWKAVGQFLAKFVDLCTLVRATFTEITVGIEILPWLLDGGKESFVEKFLKPLGKEFLATQRVRVIDDNTIEVNLGISPKLPFDGAAVESHVGEGWAVVQKRSDGLYVDNRKVALYFSEHQQDGKTVQGHELREELSGKPILNANILDALLENTHLIPEDWKGKAIFFWATVYRNRGGILSVSFLLWSGGRWYSLCHWLELHWRSSSPAACLE